MAIWKTAQRGAAIPQERECADRIGEASEFLTAAAATACVSDVTRPESVAGVFPGNYAE